MFKRQLTLLMCHYEVCIRGIPTKLSLYGSSTYFLTTSVTLQWCSLLLVAVSCTIPTVLDSTGYVKKSPTTSNFLYMIPIYPSCPAIIFCTDTMSPFMSCMWQSRCDNLIQNLSNCSCLYCPTTETSAVKGPSLCGRARPVVSDMLFTCTLSSSCSHHISC